MLIVHDYITMAELEVMSEKMFGKLVKAVVDLQQEIMVVDAFMHVDEEDLLLENGSQQEDLWGINLHPSRPQEEFVEFDSMINVRPADNNVTRGVDDALLRAKIIALVNQLVRR